MFIRWENFIMHDMNVITNAIINVNKIAIPEKAYLLSFFSWHCHKIMKLKCKAHRFLSLFSCNCVSHMSIQGTCRGGSRNFWKGGLCTIDVTFITNNVEGEWRPRPKGCFRFFPLKRHFQHYWDLKSVVKACYKI